MKINKKHKKIQIKYKTYPLAKAKSAKIEKVKVNCMTSTLQRLVSTELSTEFED